MARPRSPLPCGACDGLSTVIVKVAADPDYRVGPTVWRLRICQDCGQVDGTAEVHVSMAEVRRRLSELEIDRRALARGGMVPGREMAGELVTPGRGN